MIRFFFIAFRVFVEDILRKLYWFYNISQSNIGEKTVIQFPVIREGKGELTVGAYSLLAKKSNLGIAKGSKLNIGEKAYIEANSNILVSDNSNFVVGQGFKLGYASRLYVNKDSTIGDNVSIATHTAIFSREPDLYGKLSIGDNTNIGDNIIIDLGDDVIIGHNVALGPNCTIYTHDHIYTDKTLPAWKGGVVSKPISIEDGAWIGSNVTILPGVTIGKRAIVAAGSVVTKNVEPETIFGGVPAKKLKNI
jgi:acetyltransferase-like isoleucine patch superfamily enzyme